MTPLVTIYMYVLALYSTLRLNKSLALGAPEESGAAPINYSRVEISANLKRSTFLIHVPA